MEVSSYKVCWNGKWDGHWREAGLIDLTARIKSWADWAETNPVFSVRVSGT
jgi:hypothetical protein